MLPLTFCLASSEARSPSLSFFPSRDSSGVEAVEKEPNTSSIPHWNIGENKPSVERKPLFHFRSLVQLECPSHNAVAGQKGRTTQVVDMVCGHSTPGRLCPTVHTSSTTFPPLIYNHKPQKYCTNSSPNTPCILTLLPLPSHICLAHIYLFSSAEMLISSSSSMCFYYITCPLYLMLACLYSSS